MLERRIAELEDAFTQILDNASHISEAEAIAREVLGLQEGDQCRHEYSPIAGECVKCGELTPTSRVRRA